ncbi:12789_t:CDS:2 [Funneliformis geosporum]|uniref:11053_t:CDS:1 n=1 Tax=Funneliformis geosporum TaxID=1117311 RepID=A0A9W4WLK7_9GLOM|nr:11053_t:CDS:2 [Funneliformis geosporum]CAI2173473.1 12789_t:CDS:2 [Funneliformis geosporum]
MSLFVLDNMIIDESGGDSHENKRVKITTACDACRRRKVKCDGASPCTNCQRYQCSFSDASSKRPRGPPKGFVALIEDRLHTIESLLVNLVNKDDLSALTKRERLDSTSAESSSAFQQCQNSNDFKDPQYTTLARQNHLIIPSTPPSDSQISDASRNHLPGYTDELTIVDEEILLNNLVDPNLSNSLQNKSMSFLMLDDTDGPSDYVEPALPTTIVDLKQIPEEISRHLFEKYFNNFHPYFPIVNRVQFFRSYNNVNVQDQPSKLLVETICTIGAMYPPTKKQNEEYSSQFFYERAKNLLDRFIDVPRLSTIQALVLLCLVHQGKPSSYRSQTYSSTAINMAQSIGLNRKNGAAYKGDKNRQTKKLIWWGCFILDRLTSLMTGDPLIINDKMCDIELPSLDDLEFNDDTDFSSDNEESSHNFQQGEASQRQGSRSTSPTYNSIHTQQINTFINYIRLTKLIGQILEHLQTSSCEGLQASWNHHSIINVFESSLTDWLRELPSYLNYAPSTQLSGQIASLHMYHQTLYLLLYYPYIAEYSDKKDRKIRTTKTFTKSMNICSSAASIITNLGVESLNNVQTCITFPAMFYCLGKAAKVHSKNILSPQRALAIDSYRNIVKTIRICQFYKQNNIMKELAQKTFNSLENILKKYQDKFSHEEIFGVTPSGQIVNPDGLDLIISSFGLNANNIASSPNSSSIGIIKMNPTMSNQTYSNPMKSVQSILSLQTSSSNDNISLQKSQQSNAKFDFLHQTNNSDESQSLFVDTFDTQMIPTNSLSSNDIATTSANEPFWVMSASQSANLHSSINSSLVDGEFDTHSTFDHMTITDSPVSPPTNYFSSQSRRAQSLPSPSSPVKYYMPNGYKSSLTSNSRPNQMSLDSIEQETHTSPNSSPTSQHSQRYVSQNTNKDNENQNDSFSSENNNSFVMSERDESSMYDDDNSRMRFYNNSSTAKNETNYQEVFNKIPTTASPSQSDRRRSPPSSSSGLKKKANSYTEPAIHVLSKRHKYCGATIPSTSICIGYDGIDNDYQFEPNVVEIGGFGFENNGI